MIDTQSVPYGTTPTAPSGTPNTAQYNYSWPTVVSATADATYQETRALQYYTITFRNYQNSILDSQYLAYGATPVPPSGTPDTAQYDYEWPTISNVTAATTYKETRALKYYTVTWKDWDGTTLKTESVGYGGNGTPPPFNPTRTGYTFISWNGTYTNVTSNITITAKYDINYYTVTWKDWNNDTLKTESIAYGGNGTPPAQPTRTGYTFNTWSGDYTGITSSRTITATYTINYYTVTWKDWNNDTLKTESVAYLGNGTPPTQPTRTGYNFISWSGSYTSITSNRTITAQYEIKTYTVTFKNWDNSTLKTQYLVPHGSNATPPSDPTRTGYTFDSWSGSYTNVTSDRTITATFTINTYTVTFKDYDNSTLKTQVVNYGANATPPADPTRIGYTFNSWSGSYTNITSDRTITATYTINTYTVTFYDWDDAVLKTQTVNYNTNATPPAQPTRTGYTFSHWAGIYTLVKSNSNVTAIYTINYYTVTWKDWNGATLKTEQVAYMSNATPPTQPTRTGYTFNSWSGSYLNISSNRTITATYNVNTYVLSIPNITGIAGQTVTRTSSPNGGGSTGNLVSSALLYYGDVLAISATALNGYNVSISGSPVTVTGNVTTSTYITVTYDLSQPIITYTGKTRFSMSFTVKNQNTQYSVRIYYKAGSAPTTSSYDGYVDLAANTTSSTQTIDGLVPSTSYNIYARAYKGGSYSSSVYFNQTTMNLSAPSSWADYSKTSNSITMRVYNPNTEAVTLYYAANQNPPTANSITVPAQSYAYATVSGLSANTTYTIYGRFGYGGKYSTTVSDSATTDPAGPNYWDFIVAHSSEPSGVDAIIDATGDVYYLSDAEDYINDNYPASSYSKGTVYAIYGQDGDWGYAYVWFEFEVK